MQLTDECETKKEQLQDFGKGGSKNGVLVQIGGKCPGKHLSRC